MWIPRNILRLSLLLSRSAPKFRINKELFCELIREVTPTKSIASHAPGPSIECAHGQTNGIYGTFDQEKNHITIFVDQIFAVCLFERSSTMSLDNAFHRMLTMVLAHEGAHWQRWQRFGRWLNWERRALYTPVSLGGFALVIYGLMALLSFEVGCIVSVLSSSSLFWGITKLLCMMPALFMLWMFGLRFAQHALIYCASFAYSVMYMLCSDERLARRFADEVIDNPRWLKVVELLPEEIEPRPTDHGPV